MPGKQITFIIIPPNDGQVQEYKLSSKFLWLGGLLCLLTFASLIHYATHYYTNVDQQNTISDLREENNRLLGGLEASRNRLDNLDSLMADLAEDDQKLRVWHEMDPVRTADFTLGVGGPEEPEDLPEDYTALPARKRALLEDISIRLDRLQREVSYQQASFDSLTERFTDNSANLKYIPAIAPMVRGRSWKTSDFGNRTDPFTGRPAFHNGVDFAGRRGEPVHATADGRVIYAYEDARLGRVVVIAHDPVQFDENGNEFTRKGIYRTEYAHLDEFRVKKGDPVRRGEVIGLLGNTGRSTGPHLHYAVRYQDRRLGLRRGYDDPRDYLLDWPADERAVGWEVRNRDE
ncbi:MAG: M23 family metallopeptidase [Candidatus Latescibacterota bacterium]|nr:M23 family metallopeptidase [Candidatus Latescibacterota bacterium]